MKYSTNDWLVKNNFVVNKSKLDEWCSYHSDYANHFKAYETITPYLRSIGLKRTDRILSLSDNSINISLYFMDQKGFTAFGYGNIPFDNKMEIYKNNGVKILIIDSELNKKDYLLPYLNHKIGNYQNISIYNLE